MSWHITPKLKTETLKPESKNEVLDRYIITKKGNKTLYEYKSQDVNYSLKGKYGIENETEDIMLVININNTNDLDVLDDFVSFDSKFDSHKNNS